ncbi:hypothetical protein PULV_a2167 [Pseudoalteromonas ulvae UL12]|uniref:imelysin family protein n=1 Tax=Pseudoalteromonas ulvae TaxID=107327 RepID=UPI00186BA1FC|nr:imelysin family protein [Pseudoalteromonas ulvae]MBE0365384.1 hypothetical protein [Pseudoalteromonas ulvae UL12]
MNKYLCVMLSASLLTACGGGSKQSTPVVVEPPPVVVKTNEQAMSAILTDLADKVIIPDYQQFQQRSEAFEVASTQFCSLSQANQSDLTALQQSWLALNAAWHATRATKLGPVFKQFRYSRLQTWPDNNAAVSRGVATLLASDNLTAQVVANTQDGAQGLPALEYLIFAEQSENSLLNATDKAKRCLAVMAIAANVTQLSTELVTGWQTEGDNFRAQYVAGNGDFVSTKDALEEQLTNWFELVEIITDNKIAEPLDLLSPGVITNAEQYRSQSSLMNIEQNLLSLQRIYLGGQGYGFDDYLAEIYQAQTLDNAIKEAFSGVFTTLNDVNDVLEVAITTDDGRSQLVALSNKIKALRTIMASDFVQTTGLNPSFNSNDGD